MGCSVVLLAGVASTLGGLVFGYQLGIISGALLQLKREFTLSCVQQEALVSSLLIGALLASVVGGCMIDRHGRRNSILLSNILVLGGSGVLLFASYPALLIGRVTVGFAVCISSMSCCIYVSEVVASEHRGFLVTLYEAGITVGILAAYAINYALSDLVGGWKWMFGLAVVPALLQLVSIWFLPSNTKESSSQRELMSAAETEEPDDPSAGSSNKTSKVQFSVVYLCQSQENMRTRTAIGLGLVLFQQFTGQPNILFYASTIFHSVGFKSDASAVLASVGLGLVKVIATLASMLFSDRVGRRPLLISGCAVMAVCLIVIGLLSGNSLTDTHRPCCSQSLTVNKTLTPPSPVSNLTGFHSQLTEQKPLFQNISRDEDETQVSSEEAEESSPRSTLINWIILACMMAVVSAFAIGFGPMTWLLLSEIFPAAVRGRAFAFTNCFNWGAHLLVTFTFLNVVDAIGLSGVFLAYGLTAVGATLFFFFMLPETKGKSLEDIDRELRLNRCCKQWNDHIRYHSAVSAHLRHSCMCVCVCVFLVICRFYHSSRCCSHCGDANPSAQYQRVQYRASTSE